MESLKELPATVPVRLAGDCSDDLSKVIGAATLKLTDEGVVVIDAELFDTPFTNQMGWAILGGSRFVSCGTGMVDENGVVREFELRSIGLADNDGASLIPAEPDQDVQ